MEPVIGIVLVIVAVIAIRLIAGGLDHDRVRQYVEAKGGTVIDAHWAPFGPGWFGERSDRLYEVRYLDRDGNEHKAHCKTSMWTGVYFTEDEIVRHTERPMGKAESLEEENRRLREELERLKGAQGKPPVPESRS